MWNIFLFFFLYLPARLGNRRRLVGKNRWIFQFILSSFKRFLYPNGCERPLEIPYEFEFIWMAWITNKFSISLVRSKENFLYVQKRTISFGKLIWFTCNFSLFSFFLFSSLFSIGKAGDSMAAIVNWKRFKITLLCSKLQFVGETKFNSI